MCMSRFNWPTNREVFDAQLATERASADAGDLRAILRRAFDTLDEPQERVVRDFAAARGYSFSEDGTCRRDRPYRRSFGIEY